MPDDVIKRERSELSIPNIDVDYDDDVSPRSSDVLSNRTDTFSPHTSEAERRMSLTASRDGDRTDVGVGRLGSRSALTDVTSKHRNEFGFISKV